MNISIKKTLHMFLVVLTMVAMASCSSRPENLKLIPKDTNVIVTTNLTSLVTKGGFKDLSQFSFYKNFGEEMTKESPMMDKMIKNPFFTGINYTSDILFFSVKEEMICISIELSNGDKFTSFVDEMIAEAGMPLKIEEKDNFKSLTLPGNFIMAWDDSKALLSINPGIGTANLETETSRLFGLKPEEQINSNKEFDSFYDDQRDINIWVSTNIIEQVPGYGMLQNQMPDYIEDNFVSMHLGFETDQIIMTTGLSPNSKMTKEIEKYNIYGNEFNAKLLEYFPKDSYISVSASMNPEGYYNMIANQKEFEEAMELMNTEVGFDPSEIMSAFGGSMLFSLHGFKTSEVSQEPVPLMTFGFDIDDASKIDSLIAKLPSEEYKKVDGYFELVLDEDYSAYMIFDDEIALITNDVSRIDAFKNGGEAGSNFGDSEFASKIKDNVMYMQMNAKVSDYPSSVRNMLSSDGSLSNVTYANNYFTAVEMLSTSDNKGKYIITTGDDGTNSLFKMIKGIDDNIFTLLGAF